MGGFLPKFKVSIIVPIYNTEKYLKRCIDSLVNQTLDSIEIILVNDNSPDNSLDIMKKYKKKYPDKIVLIDSKVNKKQGGARNLGLNVANGEYIGFVDSDDWVDITMYEKLYNEATRDDCCVVDSDYYEASSQSIIFCRTSNYKSQIGNITDSKIKSLIKHHGRMWTKIFKSDLFNKIKFPEDLFYEDNEVMPILMTQVKKMGKVDEYLYYYFVDNLESTTTKSDYRTFDRLITSRNMIERFKDLSLYEKYKNEIDYRFIRLYYLNTINAYIKKFEPTEINYLYKIRNYMKENMPDYRKNMYFSSDTKLSKKIKSKLNDIYPPIFKYKIISRLIVWFSYIFSNSPKKIIGKTLHKIINNERK